MARAAELAALEERCRRALLCGPATPGSGASAPGPSAAAAPLWAAAPGAPPGPARADLAHQPARADGGCVAGPGELGGGGPTTRTTGRMDVAFLLCDSDCRVVPWDFGPVPAGAAPAPALQVAGGVGRSDGGAARASGLGASTQGPSLAGFGAGAGVRVAGVQAHGGCGAGSGVRGAGLPMGSAVVVKVPLPVGPAGVVAGHGTLPVRASGGGIGALFPPCPLFEMGYDPVWPPLKTE